MSVPENDDLLARRARLFLGNQQIVRMLSLPPGTEIKAIQASFDPTGIEIVVVNPELPVVEPYAYSPRFDDSVVTLHYFNPDDGHTYTRSVVTWDLPDATV